MVFAAGRNRVGAKDDSAPAAHSETYTPKAQPSLLAAGSDVGPSGDSSDTLYCIERLLSDSKAVQKDQFYETQRLRLDADRRARTQATPPQRVRVPD